jgi:hypothetical protein
MSNGSSSANAGSAAPRSGGLFHHDLAAQGRKLMAMLDAIAASLEPFDTLRPRLLGLRRAHAEFPRHDETLVDALVWAFRQALGAHVRNPTA